MARYTLGPGAPREIGSIGGITFQKAGSQFILRIRNAPVDKRSISQLIQRQRFAAIASQWRDRSTPEKDSFADEVINYPRLNSLGQTYFQPDNALFLGSNLNATQSETVAITTMPPVVTSPLVGIGLLSFNWPISSLQVNLDTSPVPADTISFIDTGRALPIQPPDFSSVNWFQTKRLNAGQSGNNNIFNEYTAIFGSFENMVGFVIPVRSRNIAALTGQLINESMFFGTIFS